MNTSTGITDHIRNLDFYLAAVTLAALICITVSGVFMRYFANDPIRWLEEVQLWFSVWIVFFGSSAVARKTGHIAIDAFVGMFPRRLRMASKSISNLVAILVLAFFFYYSALLVKQMYTNGRVTNILGIPYYLIYAAMPISCLLMVATSFTNLFWQKLPDNKTA